MTAYSIISVLLMIISIVFWWKIFVKNNKPGWASIVPFYNIIVILEIAELPLWYVAMFFIPIVNVVFLFIIMSNFAKKLGKSSSFGVGLALLPYIFLPILYNYITKGKEKTKKQIINKSIKEEEKIDNRKEKPVLALVLYVLLIVFVLFASIPWESLFSKFTAFSDFNTWLSKLAIGDFKVFSNLIAAPAVTDATTGSSGVISVLGNWTMSDVAILLIIISIIIVIFNRKYIKLDKYIESITSGIKKALPVAITAMLISLVAIIFITSGVNITIVNHITSLTSKLGVIVASTLGSIIGSVTTADFYYYLSTLYTVFKGVAGGSDLYGVTSFIVQSVYYLMMFIAPTSVALIVGLYSLDIPYGKWFKYIWKVLLSLLIIVLVAAVIIYVAL